MSSTNRKSRQIQRWVESNPEKVETISGRNRDCYSPYSVFEFEGQGFGTDAFQHVIDLAEGWVDPGTEVSCVMEPSVADALSKLTNLKQHGESI